MANFFYANNVSFLISNSASFAELVEALKRAPQFKFAVAAKSCPARALASPQLKHRKKSCPVPAGGCWKYIKNGPYSTSAEIHKKRFCLLCTADTKGDTPDTATFSIWPLVARI
jgi:hypothetical protein